MVAYTPILPTRTLTKIDMLRLLQQLSLAITETNTFTELMQPHILQWVDQKGQKFSGSCPVTLPTNIPTELPPDKNRIRQD
mmetsp:Transcript_96154/g.190573  ORF Transcript_96154/g.190573 Transcript_96154/m.190573 type:complete len:81 (-) Transcript_96154:469-711(-)